MDSKDKKKIDNILSILDIDIHSLKKGNGKVILISGGSCSGKSLVAQKIAEKYPDFKVINTGDIFREEAKSIGMPISEFMRSGDDADDNLIQLDKNVDGRIIKLLIGSDNNIILTSRFGALWGVVLDSINRQNISIFLSVSEKEKIARFTRREFKKEISSITSSEKTMIKLEIKRDLNDLSRYRRIYNLDLNDFIRYSYNIDTTLLTKSDIWNMVLSLLNRREYQK